MITKIRDWLFIIMGLILILFPVFSFLGFNPLDLLKEKTISPLVIQSNLPAILIPKQAFQQSRLMESEQPSLVPDRIVINRICLDAPVKKAQTVQVKVDRQEFTQLSVPEEFAAGWYEGSAAPGEIGNILINGFQDNYGGVFKNLIHLEIGDSVLISSGNSNFQYTITKKIVYPFQSSEPVDILESAQWMLPSNDERLTLVTSWLNESTPYRLILVAVPAKNAVQAEQSVSPISPLQMLRKGIPAYNLLISP